MPKICAIMIKPLRRGGFRLDGLITPTPKAAGSNPVGHTKKPLKSVISEVFSYSLFIAAQDLRRY